MGYNRTHEYAGTPPVATTTPNDDYSADYPTILDRPPSNAARAAKEQWLLAVSTRMRRTTAAPTTTLAAQTKPSSRKDLNDAAQRLDLSLIHI